jgi:predicted regulator of Ras-like GTPase activity (Roadblock/LC7/MglB family)
VSEEQPRFLPRTRRGAAEPSRPDYSEPDFSSWAAKLDAFIPTHEVATGTEPAAAATATATVEAPAEAPQVKQSSLNDDLQKMLSFDGAMCAALVDSDSGMVIGQAGSGIEMEQAAAGASMILRARRATVKALALPDHIDDLLVTLTTQLHIIRPLTKKPTIFIYLVVDRSKASLAMARYKANEADGEIDL